MYNIKQLQQLLDLSDKRAEEIDFKFKALFRGVPIQAKIKNALVKYSNGKYFIVDVVKNKNLN